ncbi:MAG: amidohydrolase [Gemmiger sp.]|uniref:amidohydrolase n=1 Tax=Gemmiger sp. TaxID=2049027 RepID=UPI002E79DB32|nr:amidohydrolase [Gemmiger sp.]MEE0099442.1 amidohydrolase [Gemmiger sp.]
MATTLIHNGLIHDAVHREAYAADILLADGKIAAIGGGLTAPADAAVFDADGLEVYPGFVDAHTHIGLDGYGIGYEGCDYNEMNDIWTPQLRAIDGINPRDPSLADARRAGVTCVCTGPGSANVLGGTFLAMKTVGDRVDKMVVRDPVAMKCAFGENPKRCYRDKCDSTRMSTAAFLRGALMQARDYGARKQAANGDITKMPAYNQKLEALLPVLAREIPLKAHAHQANDIFTALRIAREFNLRLTLEHVTEGHLIVDELAGEKDVPMAVGPSLTFASKFELQNKSWSTPAVLTAAGCHVSIITDSSVIPQQYLPLCAGMAIKAGMDPFDALKAITINPAEHIGVADRVGSLEVGKDADLVITAGSPFEVLTEVKAVFIDGARIEQA